MGAVLVGPRGEACAGGVGWGFLGGFYTDGSGVVVHVEAHSAVERRGWLGITQDALNPDLKDPLPSATYTVDGRFHYTTDEWGRTVRIQVDELRKVDGDLEKYRSESVQERVGKYGGEGYDGGHLSGHQFGGAPEDINVVPMLRKVNQNHPDSFYRLEKEIAASRGAYENIDIRIEYDGPPGVEPGTSLSGVPQAGRVPTEFRVSWTDEQRMRTVPRRFVNE
ncbi:DNA/RNA non-specific endonuclease [Actinomyces lilanjuaniae]|nr:DNA/RNA non-specific endonuclease [Actinomyces lilanjuaniae]